MLHAARGTQTLRVGHRCDAWRVRTAPYRGTDPSDNAEQLAKVVPSLIDTEMALVSAPYTYMAPPPCDEA